MDEVLIRLIRRRAEDRCEYCLIPAVYYPAPFQINHVIARQHAGLTVMANLAFSCLHCNSHKGPNLAGIDPITRKLTPLFNPRRHKWKRHFRWNNVLLVGQTPIGRTSIAVLNMNDFFLIQLRETLIAENLFP